MSAPSDLQRFRAAQMEQWAFEQRCRKADAIRTAARARFDAGDLDAAGLAEWETHAAELVLGFDLGTMRGPIPSAWSSPTQIGYRLGVSAHRVGMAITALGLRTPDPLLARRRVFERNGRPIEAWLYSVEAERLIREHLKASR